MSPNSKDGRASTPGRAGGGGAKGPGGGSDADRWLGPVHHDEPSTGAILAALSSPETGEAEEVEAFLQRHPGLRQAALDGLEELRRLEAPPSPLQGRGRALGRPGPVVLAVELPALRAAAADEAAAPLPEDHQVLMDDPRGVRLSYFRRGADGTLGLFSAAADSAALVSCKVDGVSLPTTEAGPGQVTVRLGPPRQLVGRRLEVIIQVAGEAVSFEVTLVPGPRVG